MGILLFELFLSFLDCTLNTHNYRFGYIAVGFGLVDAVEECLLEQNYPEHDSVRTWTGNRETLFWCWPKSLIM